MERKRRKELRRVVFLPDDFLLNYKILKGAMTHDKIHYVVASIRKKAITTKQIVQYLLSLAAFFHICLWFTHPHLIDVGLI